MAKPTLYLMLGYPGAGKTTAAKYINQLTGAVHLWADHIRRERYGRPTYSHKENLDLYNHMNRVTGELLAAKNSVVFDTNFNFYKDRQHLREIAREHGADSVLVWVTTPKNTARERATDGAQQHQTRILGDMSEEDFERLSSQLEAPLNEERIVKIPGKDMTLETVREALDTDHS